MVSKNQFSNVSQNCKSLLELGAVAILALATVVMLCAVLVRSRYGIDLTDEGFYLNWMKDPSSYTASVSHFGFVYHVLYQIAQSDVALIRQINYVITFGLAWVLCIAVFRLVLAKVESTPADQISLVALSATIAFASILVVCFELPQGPSYNTLAYQSVLLGVIGMILAEAKGSRSGFLGYFLIGLSWWLAFMAKPTTAVSLCLVGLLYLFMAGKFSLRLLAASFATAVVLFVTSSWGIDGSIYAFIERMARGVEMARSLGANNSFASILRWDKIQLSSNEQLLLLLNAILISLAVVLSASERRGYRIAGIGFTVICALVSITIFAGLVFPETSFGRYHGLQILALPIACLIAAIITSSIRNLERSEVALAISLVLLPHAYAFGTDRPYWLNAQGAALFWVLSGIVIVALTKTKGGGWRVLLPVCGACQLFTALFLYGSMEHPQRQTQPLWLNANTVHVGHDGKQLILSRDFADYIEGLRRMAREGEFKGGTPIIDMTGHSPGVVYVLNARSPGLPWLLGGYKGSDAFAMAALELVSCDEISRAWVIIEPTGPRKLSDIILKRSGIDLEQDYQDLGEVHTPAVPLPDPISQVQHLLKPRRAHDVATSACEVQRRERAS